MAKVNQRLWRIPGQRAKHKAWGFTVQVDGKQTKSYRAEWTKEDAEKALAAVLLKIEPAPKATAGMTLAQAVDRYVAVKARKKSLAFDRQYLALFTHAFGANTPLADVTASRISAWKADRLSAICPMTKQPYSAAAVNRPLAALRHLLQLAHDEWGELAAVPRIRLEKEPEGRIKWLEPDEEARLLGACAKSKNPHLAKIVTVALETGLREGELMGLTWDRVDLSRGVIRLELTKSGRRREVPMRQVVYDTLSSLPGPRTGRVWPDADIRAAWEYAVIRAKLDDFHFHDCRHHFASWFIMRGGRLPALRELLGHASLSMTLRYAHLAPDHLRDEIVRTERQRQPQPTDVSAQASAQEPLESERVSRNSAI
jgi:integrase